MHRLLDTITTILLLFAAASSARGRTWVVDGGGGGDFTTVSAACDTVESGDTIEIRPGDYDEYDGYLCHINITAKNVTVVGRGAAPEDVRLRLSMYFSDCEAVLLENLFFHDEWSPVSSSESNVTVRHCEFRDNRGFYFGGGIIFSLGALLVEDCEFVGNRAENATWGAGGAIASDEGMSGVTFRRCKFIENFAMVHSGAVAAAENTTFEDCLFLRNESANGAAIRCVDPTLVRCTFVGNRTTSSWGAALEVAGYHPRIRECIIAGTRNGYGVGCWDAGMLFCCCLWQNERGPDAGCSALPDDGNLQEDPLFCSPASDDYSLRDDSPCLPGIHGGGVCGRMGAFDIGCGETPVEKMTWGRIKQRYLDGSK